MEVQTYLYQNLNNIHEWTNWKGLILFTPFTTHPAVELPVCGGTVFYLFIYYLSLILFASYLDFSPNTAGQTGGLFNLSVLTFCDVSYLHIVIFITVLPFTRRYGSCWILAALVKGHPDQWWSFTKCGEEGSRSESFRIVIAKTSIKFKNMIENNQNEL